MPSVNYGGLLESLFLKGLSPKSESVIEGLSKFFKHSYFEEVSGDGTNLSIAKSIGQGLVKCLYSKNYRVVEVASRVLREYMNSIYEIPQGSVQALIEALNKTVPSSATQAAFALGCIGCTKPQINLLPGIRPIDDIDAAVCWGCMGGFLRKENDELIIPPLVKNLDRSLSRDRSRQVRRACAIALGEIGYTTPTAINDALKPLRACLKEDDGRDGVIFALGCVGYTRPDLIEDLIDKFKICSTRARPSDSLACHNALKKIGMQTDCVLHFALEGKRSLTDTMEIFFKRMMEYEGPLVYESMKGIETLAKKLPKDVVSQLNRKLAILQQEDKRTGHLAQNITMMIDLLSERFSSQMKDTVPLLIEHFRTKHPESYRTMDSSARALRNIFRRHPEVIPDSSVKTLEDFLKEEKRASVIMNTRQLLEEISTHL